MRTVFRVALAKTVRLPLWSAGIGGVAIVAIPVVIGILGYQAGQRQSKVENERAEFAQMNVVMDRLASDKPRERSEALNVLAYFIDSKECEFPQLIVPALAQSTGDNDPNIRSQANRVMVLAFSKCPVVSSAISTAIRYNDNIAEAVYTVAKTNPMVTAKLDEHANELPKRVYIQIKDESQKEDATDIQKKLRDNGLVAPGIEIVGSKMPSHTELRYFHNSDESQAQKLAQLIQHNAQPKFISGWEKKAPLNQYELWLAPQPADKL
jgi:hypothetical protein